jgi:calcineurin-like phosphoesterase family protein
VIYFTADTHFGHDRTRVLHKRPFDSVEDMNATLIRNWNSVVQTTDTVYHLGDFGVPDPNILQQLNGGIYFLPSQDYDDQEVVDLLSQRATLIQPNTVITAGGQTLQLIHEPLTATPGGHFYLFGHIHRFQMVKRDGLCVSSDAHFFTPISLETVLFYKNAIENFYDENVFVERLGGNQP